MTKPISAPQPPDQSVVRMVRRNAWLIASALPVPLVAFPAGLLAFEPHKLRNYAILGGAGLLMWVGTYFALAWWVARQGWPYLLPKRPTRPRRSRATRPERSGRCRIVVGGKRYPAELERTILRLADVMGCCMLVMIGSLAALTRFDYPWIAWVGLTSGVVAYTIHINLVCYVVICRDRPLLPLEVDVRPLGIKYYNLRM